MSTNPTSQHPVRIATRGSALALAQARMILAQCQSAFPSRNFELKIIKTTGDKLLTASLANPELPKGLFTKELEVALLEGQADLAVHSLKDLPTDLPAKLALGAVGRRADVRDVLIYREGGLEIPSGAKRVLDCLPPGAVVATSSTRRAAQLLDRRPDAKTVPIRGNVGTRLKKVAEQPELHGTLLAAAGLARLGMQIDAGGRLTGREVPAGLLAAPLEPEEMLPCVGQAAIGIEVRANDKEVASVCGALDDAETHACVKAERAFLQAMGGGCHLAVAAYGQIKAGQLRLRAISFLGGSPVRGEGSSASKDADGLGRQLAAELGGPAGLRS